MQVIKKIIKNKEEKTIKQVEIYFNHQKLMTSWKKGKKNINELFQTNK